MARVYRKTAKGYAEIETRAHRLAPRLRAPLIMVDGIRSDDDLRNLITAPADEILQALLDQGFIEIVAASAPAASAATASAKSEVSRSSAPRPDGRPPAMSFEEWRRLAVRSLTDQVGPSADSVALRMERARSAAELLPLLVIARDMVGNVRGRDAAAAFNERFMAPPAS